MNLLTCGLAGLLIASSLMQRETPQVEMPGQIELVRPGARQFVLDTADMVNADDEQKIKQIADRLLTDQQAPIIVVTIKSMAQHGGAGLEIETFTRLLFDQWRIGPAELGGAESNKGMLLVVSQQDRKARIELGAGWNHQRDVMTRLIMDRVIIPRFKRGDFSGGILAGVEALDAMARDRKLPGRPPAGSQPGGSRPAGSHFIVGMVCLALVVFTVVSLIRRGSRGWAWGMWGGLFRALGAILYHMAASRSHRRGWHSGGSFNFPSSTGWTRGRSSSWGGGSRSSGGGGYSGGSFGGGFSGGGGASGSW
jgi:uncharacterized protein